MDRTVEGFKPGGSRMAQPDGRKRTPNPMVPSLPKVGYSTIEGGAEWRSQPDYYRSRKRPLPDTDAMPSIALGYN